MSGSSADVSPLSPAAQERGLDQLAALMAAQVEPSEFFRELVRTLLDTVAAEAVAVWLRVGPTEWMRLSQTRSASAAEPLSERCPAPEWVRDVLTATAFCTMDAPDGNGIRLAGPIRQAGEVTGVLSLEFVTSQSWDGAIPFVRAVGDLAGEFLALHELHTLRQDRAERQQWEAFHTRFASATRLEQLAGIIAHDGRTVCLADRLTVARFTGSGVRILAVSGVDTIDPRSPTVRVLEALALAARNEKGIVTLPGNNAAPRMLHPWNELATAGTRTALIKTLWSSRDVPLAAIIAERFTERSAEGWSARVDRIAAAALPWWIALEAAQRPWWRGPDRHRQTPRSRSRGMIIGGLVAALILALTFIPVPLKITAEGELTPVERRDLFATANGLVEQVFVKHADRLAIGQPLVQLRDPSVEMEATRVTGELATARARLDVIEAARIASTTTSGETAARLQQLAGEAADLRQQIHALETQQAMLETERESWTLKSPIAGQVLTWDVESLLSGRPIERGQVLLTVGNTAGDWEITARIRERDLRHWLGRTHPAHGHSVEFVSVLDPETPRRGRVTQVSRVTDLNERGESTVRVTIALDEPRLADLQTGTTVWPRIDCGRHPLGYVWFHDLIDAVRSGIWLRR